MADRRASLEGITSRSRHRSPASEAFSAHHENVATSSGAAQRRRPARTKANSHDTPHHSSSSSSSSIWVDTAKGESRKAKRGSESPATEPRGDSPDNTASARSSSGESEQEGNADTVQSLPNLSRISERKQSKKLRRRGGSTTSSTTDQSRAFRRRRPTEDGILGRRSIRPNHGSSQKRAETLGKLPNPSLLSILSELTQQSSASNDSNTTITQKSYDDKSYISKLKAAAKGKKREQTKKQSAETKTATMEAPQSNVFQFLNEGLSSEQFLNGVPHGGRPMTSSSTSSSAASHDTESEEEDSASDTEETVADTPMTSPTSTRRSGSERSRYREGVGTNVGVPVHQNGAGARPVHPSQSHHYEVEDAESEDGEEEEGEQSEEETDEDNNGDGSAYVADHGHAHHLALERAPPPRIPSAASSQRSDPHTRRLRRQERELANHILQSPQPHREFQFIGGASPHPYPAMPMYDTYPHSGASPPAQQTLGWPPPPPVPPPPPIGYNTPPHAPPAPYSPDNGNRFAMASHSPMAAPNMAVRVSPYHHTAVHPPQYQAQPPGTDLSRSTVVGYELLADKLSEPPKNKGKGSSTEAVVPMYRKFQSLNHRVLLHLQDEICELEEELRSLDECIVQSSPRDELGRMHPASRRGDARYGGELHYRRTELLGRVYLKLGQYNQALSSFSNLVKTLEPADTEDIQAYQAWMEKRAPIDYTESRFLDRKDDLLAVSQRRRGSAGGSGHRHSAAVGLPLILVLPLMAFAIVPGLLGRLFTIVLIGCAEVRLVTTTPELMEFMTVDEWIKCGSVYFGVMALLAALVR